MDNQADTRGRTVQALLDYKATELKYQQQGLEEIHRTVRWGLGIAIGGIVLYQLALQRPWAPQDLSKHLHKRLQVTGTLLKQQRIDDVRACGLALQRIADIAQKPGDPNVDDVTFRDEALAIVRDRCTATFE